MGPSRGAALDTAEAVLGLMFEKDGKIKNDTVRITNHSNVDPKQEEESTQSGPAHVSLVIHILLSGTIFFLLSPETFVRPSKGSSLHDIADSGALEGFKFLSLRTSPGSPYHPPTHTSPSYIYRQRHCKTGPSGQKPKETALGRSSNQYSQYCKRGY
ncbi:hypothetical protein BDR03DRAFT_162207 [Suillus americanus]|nr:hypothetical protein BDR03DRAFT_162207 [Suillus americanus]